MGSHKITEFQLPSVSIRNHCPIKDIYLSGFKSLGGTKVCVKQKSHNICTIWFPLDELITHLKAVY